MQNEACIKQGSEKESFRQMLKAALDKMEAYQRSSVFDETEQNCVVALYDAAKKETISPKAFLAAEACVENLENSKEFLLAFSDPDADNGIGSYVMPQNAYHACTEYLNFRAQLLGFKKSLSPKGWEILED